MARKAGNPSRRDLLLSIKLNKLAVALPFVALLAACSGQQNALEDRVINVESDAIPTAATPTPDMSGLLRQTSPSYVTLTVSVSRRKGKPGDGDAEWLLHRP